MAVAYGLLVVLGLLPATNTLFGLVPIYGYDVWLHLVLGVVAAYFGFKPRSAEVKGTVDDRGRARRRSVGGTVNNT